MFAPNSIKQGRFSIRASIFVLHVLVSAASSSANAEGEIACGSLSEAQAVDAAIAYHVEWGRQQQEAISQGTCRRIGWKLGMPCVNSEPYFSIDEFKSKNADCCKIAENVPGDFSESLRPYIVGKKQPRVFLVELKYNLHYIGTDGRAKSRLEHMFEAVDCRGKVMRGGFRPWP